MRVCGADEAARIVALGLLGLVVHEARGLEVGAHALGAGEPGGVDAGLVHHPHVLVEIVEELMDRIARRALRVVVQDQPVAGVLLDQLAWCEVVLEIDDHWRFLGIHLFPAASAGPTVKRRRKPRVNYESTTTDGRANTMVGKYDGPACAGPSRRERPGHLPRRSGPWASVLMR